MKNPEKAIEDVGLITPETAFRLMALGLPQKSSYYWIRIPCSRKPGSTDKGAPHVHIDTYKLVEQTVIDGASKDGTTLEYYRRIDAEDRKAAAWSAEMMMRWLRDFAKVRAQEFGIKFVDGEWHGHVSEMFASAASELPTSLAMLIALALGA